MKVHHIALRTADPEALAAFYTSMLDLPVVRRQLPRSIWLGLEDAVLMIERAEPGEPGVAEGDLHLLALAVDAPTQARLRARLAAAGVPLDGETAFTLYLRDPDGRRVGLSTYPLRELDQPSA